MRDEVRARRLARQGGPLIGLLRTDAQHYVWCAYETERDCHLGESSACDPICRCARIVDPEVSSVMTASLALAHARGDLVLAYCVERLLMRSPHLAPGNWDIETRHGYYGEEIGRVSLRDDPARALERDLTAFGALARSKRVPYVLRLEYERLLPEVERVQRWQVVEVERSRVRPGNPEYARERLSPDIIKRYMHWQLPRAICLEERGGYRIIDGYHRMAALPDEAPTVSIVSGR